MSTPCAPHAAERVGNGEAASLQTRTQAAAVVAARHAGAVDAESRFPKEAFEAIRAQRLLGALVPRHLGGEGASVAEIADLCFCLGQVCASTGMIYAMHQVKVACLVRHSHGNGALENLMRRLCKQQLLLASSTTEGRGGGNVRSSEAPIEHVEGRIRLERQASVISYGAQADGLVTTARRAADPLPRQKPGRTAFPAFAQAAAWRRGRGRIGIEIFATVRPTFSAFRCRAMSP